VVGIAALALVIIGGLALAGITGAPWATENEPREHIGSTPDGDGSPKPVTAVDDPTEAPTAAPDAPTAAADIPTAAPDAPTAAAADNPTPADGSVATLIGALTLYMTAPSADGSSADDAPAPARSPEPPWAPVKAELDALIALRDSGDIGAEEFLDAYNDLECVGVGDMSDLASGQRVRILNEQGEVIASGALEDGSSTGHGSTAGCRFPFTIDGIPPAARYTVDVGRISLDYSREQLESRGWTVELVVRGSN
jgi:hypothetical protein